MLILSIKKFLSKNLFLGFMEIHAKDAASIENTILQKLNYDEILSFIMAFRTCQLSIKSLPQYHVKFVRYYTSANMDGMRTFYLFYPWGPVFFSSDDPSTYAAAVTDVVHRAWNFIFLALWCQSVASHNLGLIRLASARHWILRIRR